MSDALGPLAYGASAVDRSLGPGMGAGLSAETARAVDVAVRGIVESNYVRARELLEAHESDLRRLAEALIEQETLDGEQIEAVLKGQGPPGPARNSNDETSGQRFPVTA